MGCDFGLWSSPAWSCGKHHAYIDDARDECKKFLDSRGISPKHYAFRGSTITKTFYVKFNDEESKMLCSHTLIQDIFLFRNQDKGNLTEGAIKMSVSM